MKYLVAVLAICILAIPALGQCEQEGGCTGVGGGGGNFCGTPVYTMAVYLYSDDSEVYHEHDYCSHSGETLSDSWWAECPTGITWCLAFDDLLNTYSYCSLGGPCAPHVVAKPSTNSKPK